MINFHFISSLYLHFDSQPFFVSLSIGIWCFIFIFGLCKFFWNRNTTSSTSSSPTSSIDQPTKDSVQSSQPQTNANTSTELAEPSQKSTVDTPADSTKDSPKEPISASKEPSSSSSSSETALPKPADVIQKNSDLIDSEVCEELDHLEEMESELESKPLSSASSSEDQENRNPNKDIRRLVTSYCAPQTAKSNRSSPRVARLLQKEKIDNQDTPIKRVTRKMDDPLRHSAPELQIPYSDNILASKRQSRIQGSSLRSQRKVVEV